MEKRSFLEKARALIYEAETGQAIDLAEGFLKNDPRYRKLYKETLRLAAQFSKTKRDETAGTISFDNAKLNYAQVNDGLLHLLEYVENDELNPAALRAESTGLQSVYQSNKWLFLAGLPTLVLSLLVVFLVFREKKAPDGGPPTGGSSSECGAGFLPEAYPKILVLPFFLPTGGDLKPQGSIVERLEEFSDKYELRTDVKICDVFKPDKLLNYDEADVMGRANASDIIIWGRAEKAVEIALKTRFKFLGMKDSLTFTNLKWQGETQIDTVKVLSIITSNGELTGDVENTILLVLGMAADQMGDAKAAIAALESALATDSSAMLVKNMVLAENYLRTGQPDKALAAYDTALQVKPNYWLSENNRGVLRAANEDYLGAIDDFSKVLAKRPKDAETVLARGFAYQFSDQLKQAVQDFETYQKLQPEKAKIVQPQLDRARLQVKVLEEKVRVAEQRPINKWTQKEVKDAADATHKLGDNEKASKFVQKGLDTDPNDPAFVAKNVELKLRKGDEDAAKKALNEAIARGVSKDKILKQSKLVQKFSERMN